MHLTEVCTDLTSVSINEIKELGVSVVLLRDDCVANHRSDRVLGPLTPKIFKISTTFRTLKRN